MYDAIIIGGGPAGLSAALVLGRARRRVLVCDNLRQRNRRSHAMHGYLTRDGIPPQEFLKRARDEVTCYGVEIQTVTVTNARAVDSVFEIVLEGGATCRGRKLLIATGVADKLPPISNVDDFYGLSVHHCPYCDGWEHRDGRIAAYSKKAGTALDLTAWSKDIMLFTDGPARLSQADLEKLASHGIAVRKEKIARLEGAKGRMTGVILASGETIARDALFFSTGQSQACNLATGLGCILNKRGTIETDKKGFVNVPGLFLAGDATHDVQLVIVAAAEGAKAAIAINESLLLESR
ncbi:MAG: NAD(P)/FAD-dependent oxidoreductase [Acidobacteriota bacterium]|nr:NAD(P)/FAD-dependent oxidoreductase [Acidobacteriota bacterium]